MKSDIQTDKVFIYRGVRVSHHQHDKESTRKKDIHYQVNDSDHILERTEEIDNSVENKSQNDEPNEDQKYHDMNDLNNFDQTNPNNKFQKKKRDLQDQNNVHRFQKTCRKHIRIVDTV